jgi:Holliday junction DNA helicase RuvA
MIGLLTGRVASEQPEGALVVDVNGVGYELLSPVGTLGRCARVGQQVVLHVHTHVREGAIELFGFASEQERQVFRAVIGVPGVGPRIALGLLSALPPQELGRAVAAGDLPRLTRVPGVGKKTAERLILELRGKLGPAEGTTVARIGQPDNAGRLLAALTNMGYRAAEAERVVRALEPEIDRRPIGELIREALSRLTP